MTIAWQIISSFVRSEQSSHRFESSMSFVTNTLATRLKNSKNENFEKKKKKIACNRR